MIKAEREAMQRVGNFVTVGGKLREIDTHGRESRLRCCNRNDPGARKNCVTVPRAKRSFQ
jgi:hypothetical protein